MNRDALIRILRKLARKRRVLFEVDKKKGKGSHYWVMFDDKITMVQDKLNPGRIERVLKQLELTRADLE